MEDRMGTILKTLAAVAASGFILVAGGDASAQQAGASVNTPAGGAQINAGSQGAGAGVETPVGGAQMNVSPGTTTSSPTSPDAINASPGFTAPQQGVTTPQAQD